MYHQYREGYIEVICGCMFAGKTEELIRRINVLSYAKQKILVFKPKIDDRYSEIEIASHSGRKVPCYAIDDPEEILDKVTDDVQVVAIDEVQFFDSKIVDVCEYLADKGVRVMVAGLDKDFRGEAFGVMPELLTRGEFVTKLTAVCAKCGAPAYPCICVGLVRPGKSKAAGAGRPCPAEKSGNAGGTAQAAWRC